MPMFSRIKHVVRKCKRYVGRRSSQKTAGEVPNGVEASVSHTRTDGLCNDCSLLPWDDISKMSKRETFMWDGPTSSPSTCLICRLLKASITSERPHPWFEPKLKLDKLGFGITNSDRDDYCLLGHAFATNIFSYPTLLLSRADHDLSMARLRHIYPAKACLESAKKWIADCKSEHGFVCSQRDPPRLENLSVIDCKEMKVVAAPRECDFVALSYVWGESTGSETEQAGGLPPWDLLPRTVQQSIQVTCDLDCRYLWVDRYCIRQDDSEDQRTQINQMGDIYAAAHVTIVAAAGQDPSYGLPGVSPTLREPPKSEKIGPVRVYALPMIEGLADAFYYSKWITRAWTFQECFFSRRRLIFTDRQMIFVCNTGTCYEATTTPMLSGGDDDWLTTCTPRSHETSYLWLDYIPMSRAQNYLVEYSCRLLKFDGDAMNAISGALNTLTRDKVYHIWGVPFHFSELENLDQRSFDGEPRGEISLSWSRSSRVRRRNPQTKENPSFGRRRKEFPSWSPLGWDCPISCGNPVEIAGVSVQTAENSTSLQALVAESEIVPVDCSQQLRLELGTTDLTIVRATKPPRHPWEDDEWMVALHYQNGTYVYFETVWNVDPEELPDKTKVKGILLPYTKQNKASTLPGSACVLLVQPCGAYYMRVGFARLELDARNEGRYVPYHEEHMVFLHKRKRCKFMNSPEIEKTTWWQAHFTKESIILG